MKDNLTEKKDVIESIKKECLAQGVKLNSQIAYVLATVYHETAHTFMPIKEYGGEKYLRGKKYYPYFGRGYVQLTWKNNYKKFEDLLKIPLVTQPDLALEPKIALFVLVYGMKMGSFGPSMLKYINDKTTDFVGARHSVNGHDRADLIAGYARQYLEKLNKGEI